MAVGDSCTKASSSLRLGGIEPDIKDRALFCGRWKLTHDKEGINPDELSPLVKVLKERRLVCLQHAEGAVHVIHAEIGPCLFKMGVSPNG